MASFRFIQWLVEWIENQSYFAFEWDLGNRTKNFVKHGITVQQSSSPAVQQSSSPAVQQSSSPAVQQAESVFDQPEAIRVLGEQIQPRVNEPRLGILGLTRDLEHVFVCFTIRGSGIRIIHIRRMNKKERRLYAELCKE